MPSHSNSRGVPGNVFGERRDPGNTPGVAGNPSGELRRSQVTALLPHRLSGLTCLGETPQRPGLLPAAGALQWCSQRGSPSSHPWGPSRGTAQGLLRAK